MMNILQEIEAARKRALQEINSEFDSLIDRLVKEGLVGDPKAYVSPYEMKYPLTAGAGIFKGKKPTAVIINGESISIRTWKQLVEEVMKDCTASEECRNKLAEMAGKVSGKKRAILDTNGDGMRSPLKIGEKLYMEVHYDTETLLNVLMTRILMPVGYDFSNVFVTVRNV